MKVPKVLVRQEYLGEIAGKCSIRKFHDFFPGYVRCLFNTQFQHLLAIFQPKIKSIFHFYHVEVDVYPEPFYFFCIFIFYVFFLIFCTFYFLRKRMCVRACVRACVRVCVCVCVCVVFNVLSVQTDARAMLDSVPYVCKYFPEHFVTFLV